MFGIVNIDFWPIVCSKHIYISSTILKYTINVILKKVTILFDTLLHFLTYKVIRNGHFWAMLWPNISFLSSSRIIATKWILTSGKNIISQFGLFLHSKNKRVREQLIERTTKNVHTICIYYVYEFKLFFPLQVLDKCLIIFKCLLGIETISAIAMHTESGSNRIIRNGKNSVEISDLTRLTRIITYTIQTRRKFSIR